MHPQSTTSPRRDYHRDYYLRNRDRILACDKARRVGLHIPAVWVESQPGEEWRPVVGYEDLYSVSDLGRVRREAAGYGATPGRVLRAALARGYLQVVLSREGRHTHLLVHRLVLAAFTRSATPGEEANHINGAKTDNRPANLEWVTPSGNTCHAVAAGLLVNPGGSHHPEAKLTEADVLAIRAARGRVMGKELARRFGVSKGTISTIQHRRSWKHI